MSAAINREDEAKKSSMENDYLRGVVHSLLDALELDS
jgi:hypothetical protein